MSAAPQERPVLTPGAFLVRGLAAGLVAGILAFLVAFAFGEPYVDDAIALEEAAAVTEQADKADGADRSDESRSDKPSDADHEHDEAAADEGVEISRDNQRSWGLLTGTLAIGIALGGLTSLAVAAVVGRLGNLSARGSTALVALIGFVAVALVPFAKYPATPPAVGSGETIGGRTASYFALLLVSVLAAIAAVVIANRLRARLDGWTAATVAAVGYVVVVSVVAWLLPSVNEVGAFPADTLWYFRRSSLLVLATLWAGIGIVLVALVGRLHDRVTADLQRRALAASL